VSEVSCQHHPERAAQGVCVHCRTPLCGECTTKIDGINHCRSCLDARSIPAPPAARPAPLSGALTLGLGVAALWLLAWVSLNALLPGGP
jgi:hypothetical protein